MEATLIFPVILFTYIFLVYLGIYQYDRCVLEQDLRCALVRTKELSGMGDSRKEFYVSQVFEELNEDKRLALTLSAAEFEEKYDKVQGNVTGQMAVPFLQISENGLRPVWSARVEGSMDAWNPVAFIRLCERVRGMAEDGNN